MVILKDISDKYKMEVYYIAFTILLFIFRSSNPLFKYPFFLMYALYLPWTIMQIRKDRWGRTTDFLREFTLVFLFFAVFCMAFILSNKFYLIVFKEIISTVILLSFFYFLIHVITTREKLRFFIDALVELIILFSVIITISGILDTFGILRYRDYFLVETSNLQTFPFDNNFGLLPVIFSVVSIVYFLAFKNVTAISSAIYELLLLIFSFFILLSGSRRGAIVLLVLTAAILVFCVSTIFIKRIRMLANRKRMMISFMVIIFNCVSICVFITRIPFPEKNRFLDSIGTKDLIETRENISSHLLRIYSLFDNSMPLKSFHDKVWSMEFDSYEPDRGWGGTGVHRTVFPLTGNNYEIVPPGSKGYLMDSTFRADSWDGNAYAITQLGRLMGNSKNKVRGSVYCYVSQDFNCDWAKLVLLYTRSRELHSDYDMTMKGTWQKLILEDSCIDEYCYMRFYFTDLGTEDLSEMNGHVIIAYPQFETFNENGLVESYYKLPPADTAVSGSLVYLKNFPNKSAFLPGLNLKYRNLDWKVNDPFRTFINQVFSEDTTYSGFSSKLIPDSVKLPLHDSRLTRWQIGMKMYFQEYSFISKIFGGGFKHMNWYSFIFLKSKTISDWPHNPFISVLLYSGIIGLCLYLIIVARAVVYTYRYFMINPLPFLYFIIAFIFSFVSGDSPFDPPIMGFFTMLPFLIHYVHKTDPGLVKS